MSRIFKSVSVREHPAIVITAKPDESNSTEDESEEDQLDDDVAGILPSVDPHQEAEAIIHAARQQASEIASEAAAAAEQLKRESYDEGYRHGYRDGLEQVRQAIDDASSRAQGIITAGEQQAAEALVAAERQMVEIALAVSRKILASEIEENPSAVLSLVRAALAKVSDQEQITIRVSPQNLDAVKQIKPELQSSLGRDGALNIVADDGLKSGDCVVDTPYGSVDARIDTQMDSLTSALRDIEP